MITIPNNEKVKFENTVCGQARNYGLDKEGYLRKVWYHEQASRLGEYMAMVLVNDLLELFPDHVVSEAQIEESG
jgi:hypothetical protein